MSSNNNYPRRNYRNFEDRDHDNGERNYRGSRGRGRGRGNQHRERNLGFQSHAHPHPHVHVPFRQHQHFVPYGPNNYNYPHHHYHTTNFNNNPNSNGYGRPNNVGPGFTNRNIRPCSSGSGTDILSSIPESVISAIREVTTLITNPLEAAPVVKKLMEQSFIALDCEGANLGKNGKMSTVQIGTEDGKAYIFDVFDNMELMMELKNLLEAKSIVKAIHDCRNDSENFYCQYQICLENVFDTQCAHTVAEQEEGRNGRDLGLNELCEAYGVQVNYFKETAAKKVYQRNPAFWLNRPMSPEMILYAASDVITVANLYPKLRDRVSGSKHFELVCKERTNYHLYGKYTKQTIRHRENERRLKIQQQQGLVPVSGQEGTMNHNQTVEPTGKS